MRRVRFLRDFQFHDLIDRKNCVLCKVMGIREFKKSDAVIVVSEKAAKAALDAGAAVEVRS